MTNPTIYVGFLEGSFVVIKTLRNFSSILIDHAHEQNNKLVKKASGTTGMTGNTPELTRWMICGPEMAKIVNEFEENMHSRRGSKAIYLHHKQTRTYEDKFRQNVVSLVSMIGALENPFLENDETLVSLDTKDIAENIFSDTVNQIESVGKQKSQEFITERLVKKTESVDGALYKNKLSHHYSQNIRLTSQLSKRTYSFFPAVCSKPAKKL